MRVHHISSAPFTGGAARASFRLHEGLLKEPGMESIWLDPGTGASGLSVLQLPHPHKRNPIVNRLRLRFWSKVTKKHFQSTTQPSSNPFGWGTIEMLKSLPIPDIWNLHWMSWFLNWDTMLPWMAERAPIVWTLHDLNPLRGFWHYDPQSHERSVVREKWETKAITLKRKALTQVPRERITFVGPSRWMLEECRKSPVTTGFPVKHIPYGLDTDVFAPRDHMTLRRMFNISSHSFVLGFVADNIQDPRKGLADLLWALKKISANHKEIVLLTVGNGRIEPVGFDHIHLGGLQNDHLLSHFYSACDQFVCPSHQDNLPNTVLESLACGTEVVAYKTGGLIDMVIDGITGYPVEPVGDKTALRQTLSRVLDEQPERKKSCATVRAHAMAHYTTSIQSRHYRTLYEQIGSIESLNNQPSSN